MSLDCHWYVAVPVEGVSVAVSVSPTVAVPLIATALSACVPVAANTAVTVPLPAGFVAVAPSTWKLFSETPVSVYPLFGVSVIVAVYSTSGRNGLLSGVQVTVPVYSAVSVTVVTGVAPATGAVTPAIDPVLRAFAATCPVALLVTVPVYESLPVATTFRYLLYSAAVKTYVLDVAPLMSA